MAKQVIFHISNFLNKLACTTNTVPTTTTTTNTMQVNPKIDLPQFKVDTTFNDNWSVPDHSPAFITRVVFWTID